jgi:hypothetical protein
MLIVILVTAILGQLGNPWAIQLMNWFANHIGLTLLAVLLLG